MPHDGPHRLTLFSLVSLNEPATEVLNHPDNAHLVSTFRPRTGNAVRGLGIGPFIGSKSRYTLATIGRSGDITVEGPGISPIHRSFELHQGNKSEVMLQDRSSDNSTKLFGETTVGFQPGRGLSPRAQGLGPGFGGGPGAPGLGPLA